MRPTSKGGFYLMAQHIPDEILYDVRLIERHIQQGLLTRDAVEKRRLASPDLTEQTEFLNLDQVAANRSGAGKRTVS